MMMMNRRQSCITCRKRHVRCDGARPVCSTCKAAPKGSRRCSYVSLELRFSQYSNSNNKKLSEPHYLESTEIETETVDESTTTTATESYDTSMQGLSPQSRTTTPLTSTPNMASSEVAVPSPLGQWSQTPAGSLCSPPPAHDLPSPVLTTAGTVQIPVDSPVEGRVFEYYITESGRWLDDVSPGCHMSRTLSRAALTDPLLYSTCLAYSSHILHLKGRLDRATRERYTNNALNQLIFKLSQLPQLPQDESSDDSGLAATVLLRMCEQFSEFRDDQLHHLWGAFYISSSRGKKWHLEPSDLETTSFWTFVRMSVAACFLSEGGTKCERTLVHDDLEDLAISEAALANRISYLAASLCNACWDPDKRADLPGLYSRKDELDRWKGTLPPSFEPWAVIEEPHDAFPTIRFLDTWHAIAWQFFYSCQVLLAVRISVFAPTSSSIIERNQYLEKEILAPTRQLCAVTFSTDNVGVQINGAALVAWCGQYLIGKAERSALIGWLEGLMERTKWPTRTTRDRLTRIWSGQQTCWTADPER